MITLSLTFDHRIVDGAPAARFLATLRNAIENPGPVAGVLTGHSTDPTESSRSRAQLSLGRQIRRWLRQTTSNPGRRSPDLGAREGLPVSQFGKRFVL